MTKPPNTKRTTLPRSVDYSKSFFKDFERLNKTARFDMTRLKEVMLLLIANDGPLGPEWQDHPLKGDWSGRRECHVGGDFMLAYKRENIGPYSKIIFVRVGTHSDLFDEYCPHIAARIRAHDRIPL